MKKELKIAIEAAIEAGKVIMESYGNENFEIEIKQDHSPLTIADKKANEVINSCLKATSIPVISEENAQLPYDQRKNWKACWIVDPLDGTKEFIKRNGEFTVNIALISGGKPVLGVILAPALGLLYFGVVSEERAYKVNSLTESVDEIMESAIEIKPCAWEGKIKVVGSRSHMNDDTLNYIQDLEKKYGQKVEVVAKGSSLKFCMVAEGEAHVYPRYAPTMEWDTAAGQAICEAVGLNCRSRKTGEFIAYNREDLLNSHFLVSHE